MASNMHTLSIVLEQLSQTGSTYHYILHNMYHCLEEFNCYHKLQLSLSYVGTAMIHKVRIIATASVAAR